MKKFSIILIVVLFSMINACGQTLNPTYQSVTYSELGSFPSVKDGRVFKYHDSLWFDNGSMFINLTKESGSSMTWPSTAGLANYSGSSSWGTSIPLSKVDSSFGSLKIGITDSLKISTDGTWHFYKGGNEETYITTNGFISQKIGFNSVLGFLALDSYTSGAFNSAFGTEAGKSNTSGNNNIFIGNRAGCHITTKSNRLFINSLDRPNILKDTTESIIYGLQDLDITKQKLYVNAELRTKSLLSDSSIILRNDTIDSIQSISEVDLSKINVSVLHIIPQSSAPGSPEEGDIYYDSDDHKFKGYNGSTWTDLFWFPFLLIFKKRRL